MTAPVAPGPVHDRAYWTRVIHNVAKVSPDDPRYAASRIVRDQAIQGLQDLADSSAAQDIRDITPGKVGSAVVNFGQGASLGLASKAGDVLTLKNILGPLLPGGQPTAPDSGTNTAYLQLSREGHPKVAVPSDVAGTAALATILSPGVSGLSPTAQGAVLGGGMGGARGAIEPLQGMTRSESAALMGIGGAVTGAVIGKFTSKFLPMVRTLWGNISRALGGNAAPADIAAMTEGAIRAKLGKLGVKPEIIEQAVANWKASGALSVRANPTPTVRPGETITPIAGQPKGFEVTGTRATPPVPSAPTVLEMQTGQSSALPDIGQGKTVPYYPRGGQVEQAFGAPPVSSPVVRGPVSPTNQLGVFQQYLQGATPADLGQRLATLRDLGIPLPANAEATFRQLLFGGP